MKISISKMRISHYAVLVRIWNSDAGIGLGPGDEKKGIARYLKRNPGMSFIAKFGKTIVGTIMAGHDGRRGYIYHLFVLPKYRGNKIGNRLLEHALAAMIEEGIPRCLISVLKNNSLGNDFWRAKDWTDVDFVNIYSKTLTGEAAIKGR